MSVQRQNGSQRQQQQQEQQPVEGSGEAAAVTELAAMPQQQQHQQQHQQDSVLQSSDGSSSDGRSTPPLEAPNSPLIPRNTSLSADAERYLQAPLQQEVPAVGAGAHLSKFKCSTIVFFSFCVVVVSKIQLLNPLSLQLQSRSMRLRCTRPRLLPLLFPRQSS